jgi:WD40 repeat protein
MLARHRSSGSPVPVLLNKEPPARGASTAAEADRREPGTYEFDAFVSYRRRDATQLAQWIRAKLQRFRLPPEILCELPREKRDLHSRRPRIWLDTSYEKPSDDFLLKKVFPALDNSARLIVVSTPGALENITGRDGKVEDNWLVREIDRFLGAARADRTDRQVDVVFGPGAIEGAYPGRLSEKPRWDWIDLRGFNKWRVRIFTEALDDGLAKLVAGLYEVPDRFLPLLRREERRRRHRAIIGFGVAALSVAALTTVIAIWGLVQRADALSALKNALVARAQMSVQLSREELQKKNPENALATALAGTDTRNFVEKDRAVIPDTVTAIANSMANETFVGTLRAHSDAVLKVFLDPGRQTAITVGADGEAILWNAEDTQTLRPIRSTKLAGTVFAGAQNNGMIASGSPSGQIRFWNSFAPESSPRPFDLGESPTLLAFSEDGTLIAAVGKAGRLVVWNVAKNSPIWTAPRPVPSISIITFGALCNCLIVGTLTGDLFVWSYDQTEPTLVHGASSKIISGSFARRGQFLFGTDDGRLWLTSAPLWPTPVNIGQSDGSITGLAIAPNSKLAVTTSIDGTVQIWDLEKRMESKEIKAQAGTTLTSAIFSPLEDAVALGYGDGTIGIWDIANAGDGASETLVMRGHTRSVLDLSFSADGDLLASASLDRTVRLWQLHTAQRPRMKRADRGAAFHAIARKGGHLVSGGVSDKKVQVWSEPILDPGRSIDLEEHPIALAITDDGEQVYIGTEQGDLLRWDTSGSSIMPFSRDNGLIDAIAISPDGKTLAAIGVKGKLEVCSISPSPPLCSEYSLGGWGYSVAFSEDSHWVAAASGVEGSSGLAVVRELNTNNSTVLKGHTERISSIQFNRSGNRVITVSWDGTSRIWDRSSGNELVRLVEPKGRMSTAGFSTDGQWVATISNDQTLRLWKVPEATAPSPTIIMGASDSILLSDKIQLGQLKFGPRGDILAGSLANGDINLWHVPDGTLRAVLRGDGSYIRSMYFQPNGSQITAATQSGNLIIWKVLPALGLTDDSLPSVARGILPLAGSLTGTLEKEPATRTVTAQSCGFVHEHNLGIPPHNLSGAARARQTLSIPDACNFAQTEKASNALVTGLIAEAQGDLNTAVQSFTKAASEGEPSAEIGLGDLSFVDSLNGFGTVDALAHYMRAQEKGVPHAASRLGWLLLADGTNPNIAQAKRYFEESTQSGDADGPAGLAWIDERFGNSAQDLADAFSNYVEAQYRYERDGDLVLAQEIAEERAMLARAIPIDKLPALFLAARSSINSSNRIGR